MYVQGNSLAGAAAAWCRGEERETGTRVCVCAIARASWETMSESPKHTCVYKLSDWITEHDCRGSRGVGLFIRCARGEKHVVIAARALLQCDNTLRRCHVYTYTRPATVHISRTRTNSSISMCRDVFVHQHHPFDLHREYDVALAPCCPSPSRDVCSREPAPRRSFLLIRADSALQYSTGIHRASALSGRHSPRCIALSLGRRPP